jgi:membrane protein
MPSLNWKKTALEKGQLLIKTLEKFGQDHGFFLSAGITFNLLICLVPSILLLLSLLGIYLYSDQEVLNHIRRYFENAVPSLDPRITKNLWRIIHDRKIVGILGIGGLIWTSTWVFSSLRTALNMVLQVKQGRSILRGKAIDLIMIFLAGLALLISMIFTSGVTLIQSHRFGSFLTLGPSLQFILKYIIPFFFTFGMCFLIYKIVPNRKIHYKTALQAALFTSLLWEVAKHLFGWYALHAGRFSMVYGSLSTLAVFFLWVYYSSAILLLGGEVSFLLERERGRTLG